MATRGKPEGIYVPLPIATIDPRELVGHLAREHDEIANAIYFGLSKRVLFLNVEPDKPREGDMVGADGTNWNPGGGKGVYAYYNSVWNKLG
jgi:hypothetical protein